MKVIRPLLILMLLAGTVTAQDRSEDRREVARRLAGELFENHLARMVPAKRKFDHKLKIQTTYDKFTDTTDVQLIPTCITERD